MIDLFIVSGSIALGLISAVFVTRYARNRKNSNPTLLGNVRNELNNVEFEKSVALEALGKVNQFFEEKKIDEYERDRLAKKYNNILDEYDKRVFQLNPILEAQEIYEYKNELNSIVSEYTRKIDARLKNLTGLSPNTFEDTNKDVNTETRATGTVGTVGASSSSGRMSDTNKSESFFSKIASLKINPKKNNEIYSEKERPLQKDKITQSKFSKDTIREKIKHDLQLSQDAKINTPSPPSSNTKNTTYASVNAIDSTSNAIPKSFLSTNGGELDHPPMSTKKEKENSKNIIETSNEIEKIQSDILKTLRRLEDT